jgi:cytosine/adenosine deaminase-related metal-dependent hydrolase
MRFWIPSERRARGRKAGIVELDLVVRDAELLVTMAGDEIPSGWVGIRDGLVVATGHAGGEPDAKEVLSARGCLVTPGLVNTHHHMWQNLTRSYAPVTSVDFVPWKSTLGKLWTRLDEEAAYASTWIALAELALGGCTTSSDHLFVHPEPELVDAQIRAAADVGMRFHPVRSGVDVYDAELDLLPESLFETTDAMLADCERLISRYHDRAPDAMVRVAVGPGSTFDSSDEWMRASAELAERLDVRLHTHFAGAGVEDGYSLARHGRGLIDRFEALGWGSGRSWVAHCIFPGDEGVERLGKWGTGVAHCPSSNALICGGTAPVVELRAAGVPVGLGTDGSGSTDHGSMWLEARTALLLSRLRLGPTSMTARDVLRMATVEGAACLGRSGEIGVLAEGACADLVVWPMEGPAFSGAVTDLVEAWLRAGPNAARDTVVAGRMLVRDSELQLRGLEEMLATHDRIARQWQGVAARVAA